MITLSCFKIIMFVFAILVVSLSCEKNKGSIIVPEFDGERALSYIAKQIEFGPRVPGSSGSLKCRDYLMQYFTEIGGEVDTMMFVHIDKRTGEEIDMTNIIASFNGTGGADEPRYLIGAHFDTRPRAEYDPDTSKREDSIDGANDGASGVAVLMELGNLFAKQKPSANFDLVMFDGEDYGPPGHLEEYFLGARDIVRRNIKDKYKFALVIDMIGDADLQIYREEFSNKYSTELVDEIWATAHELGAGNFVDSIGYAIHDDHLSFMTIGLPAAVIIDFDYPYWHTTHDTYDKCSAESLNIVGKVVTTYLYRL